MNNWCSLTDCNSPECHHCFPVVNCSLNHDFCQEFGPISQIREIKRVLVTGCCGFIGSHLCENLLKDPTIKILGIDNINSYYTEGINNLNLIKILI